MSAHPLASALAGLARIVSGVRVERPDGPLPHPAVFFANHTSHLDAIVLWSALPAVLRERTLRVTSRTGESAFRNLECAAKFAKHVAVVMASV